MAKKQQQDIFTRFTSKASEYLGRAWIFVVALVLLVLWASTGPLLQFSDTWQLIVNTSTTIITFLMVFIIQNTQNRDNLAVQIKLDTIMEKLGIDQEDIIEAENKSDKKLEVEQKRVQKKSEKTKTRRKR
jgi:low affinity Fe/Cu permease